MEGQKGVIFGHFSWFSEFWVWDRPRRMKGFKKVLLRNYFGSKMTLFWPILDLFLEGVDTFWVVFLSFFGVFENPGAIQAWIFQNWKNDLKNHPLKMPFLTLFGPLFLTHLTPLVSISTRKPIERSWKWNHVEKPENAIFDHFWIPFLWSDFTFFDLPEQMPQLGFLAKMAILAKNRHFWPPKMQFCPRQRSVILAILGGPKTGFFRFWWVANQ